MIQLEKEKFLLMDIPKEGYQNHCKRSIRLGSVWVPLSASVSTFLPDEPPGALVVKVSYLEGKFVAIFSF